MLNNIIKYSAILTVALLFNWWLFTFSSINIPEFIPKTPIPISGLFLFTVILTSIILIQKKALKSLPEISISKLSFLGSTVCFLSEIVFQSIRQTSISANTFNERLYYFALGVIGITLFGIVLSFFVAFQLKTKKTDLLILFIIVFLFILRIIDRYWIRL